MGEQSAEMRDRRFAFYPGCLALQRMPQYELSTKRLLAALGVTLTDMPEAACCGAPVVESFSDEWLVLGGYNLALAERMGLDILTVCGSCTNSLKRALLALQDAGLREMVNRRLAPLDLKVEKGVAVRHQVQVLAGLQDALRERVISPLPLKVALSYPCQVFRPAEVAAFDDPLRPRAMHDLVALTGATIVETGAEWECCGSSYSMSDQPLALAAGRRKLEASLDADILVDGCGNCHLLLQRMQGAIWGEQEHRRMPLLFLPQLLGLALGLAPEGLGVGGAVAGLLRRDGHG